MPPVSALLHILLRRLVLRVALMLVGMVAMRQAQLRARLATLKEGHRHRARLERAEADMARVRAALSDPAFWEDPRSAGMAATVARCVNDAGRRALARRVAQFFSRGLGMRPGEPMAAPRDPSLPVVRCTGCMAGPVDPSGRAARGRRRRVGTWRAAAWLGLGMPPRHAPAQRPSISAASSSNNSLVTTGRTPNHSSKPRTAWCSSMSSPLEVLSPRASAWASRSVFSGT